MDDLLKDFFVESADNLQRLDQHVVALEQDPSNGELVNAIFRTIHTIKGTCGFLGLPRLETVAHAAESVLDGVRLGEQAVTPPLISDVLAAVDVIKQILAELERTGAEPDGDDLALIATLERWLGTSQRDGEADIDARGVSHDRTRGVVNEASANEPEAFAGAPLLSEPVDVSDGAVRVNIGVLDRLMNMVGELVLARNQLLQLAGDDDRSPYYKPIQQLHHITAELQGAVMQTRMQPIERAWSKVSRIVRDAARMSGKQITVQVTGAETELDRQLVQAIQDPLVHMVRNAVDHGIEAPEIRVAAGKSAIGLIRLHAYHEGGHVVIEIEDDGAGIDREKVRRAAVARGLLRPEVAHTLNDRDVLRLILEPGFSTADTVTTLSGRGVGMDVVRKNVERIGGTVELDSTAGHGTRIRLRLPLTLAIISALLVRVSDEMYAIPQTGIVELVQVNAGARERLRALHDRLFYRLRETLIPVIDLRRGLAIASRDQNADAILVVCQHGAARFGLLADDVLDTQEIVVKPLGRRIKALPCYAGCTILGDGRVVMIIDPHGMVTLQGEDLTTADTPTVVAEAPREATQPLLLFENGEAGQCAVPLSLVARLEDIPVERIEQVGEESLVQYRGSLLPLLSVGTSVRDTISTVRGATRPVIVFNDGSTSFGLAVREIRDIIDDVVRVEFDAGRPGVLGTAVIAGRATELVDLSYFLAQSHALRTGRIA